MKPIQVRTREALAIYGDLKHDADGFFLIMGSDPPDNETRGSVVIVTVKGALSQFKGEGGDSYEAIVERVGQAFAADPKPSHVILRISSPGGIVAGLNECVFKLQRMSREAGIPLVACVDELAASAAYALCCACSEILGPPSAIVGSVGTISTMVSIAKRDAAEGVEYRIITSGKRKADGHLHTEISDDAEKAERARNAELADQFFALAGKARGMSPEKLKSLEAAIFVGKKAVRAGLLDDVIALDEAAYGLDRSELGPTEKPAANAGNVTDRRAKDRRLLDSEARGGTTWSHKAQNGAPARSGTPKEDPPMPTKLDALIKRTEAAISCETDPKTLATLQSKLGALMLTRAEMDDDEPPGKHKPDGDDDDDDGDEASKAAKAKKAEEEAKRASEAAKHRAKAAEHRTKMEEAEEAAKKCEEAGEEDEAHLRTPPTHAQLSDAQALIEQQTGRRGPAAMGAAMALFTIAKDTSTRVAKLEKDRTTEKRAALMAEARGLCFGKPEVEWLATQSIASIEGFVEMRRKAGVIVHTEDGTLIKPKAATPGTEESLPDDTIKMINEACAASGLNDTKDLRAALVAAHLKSHTERLKSASNGAGRF